ncbi:MAG TPA: DNA-formamidopyrimidine glycosylase, partial [Firmicutes bacterium]|nr:DNA-formamidopyrimidine glycosylase [Bacillota bacterium]
MPELPEVETIVGDLAPLLTGARIIRVQVWDPRLVRFPGAE